jgi:hypothetical protein
LQHLAPTTWEKLDPFTWEIVLKRLWQSGKDAFADKRQRLRLSQSKDRMPSKNMLLSCSFALMQANYWCILYMMYVADRPRDAVHALI